MTISMGFSCGDGSDKDCLLPKGAEATGKAEAGEGPVHGVVIAASGSRYGIESEVEFKPIEHPLEPTDEDQPVKCPMPNSSVLNDGATRKERAVESLRKRVEFSATNEEEDGMVVDMQPPARAVRKRHQTLTRDRIRLPSVLAPPQSSTILQMLRECNEFES
ncbi:uncharacterized protein LOC131227772 isoform X2 [Magnolia sinica]|uniref:uncharacterized protein LOC131227772 isoform X2 n=1 Tax=Magnolia sinica TaxID=86752 RepID=UPI00265A7472|nr:uncharacterized protein LOC131227772 isoform X2 [Magnolia sinica]